MLWSLVKSFWYDSDVFWRGSAAQVVVVDAARAVVLDVVVAAATNKADRNVLVGGIVKACVPRVVNDGIIMSTAARMASGDTIFIVVLMRKTAKCVIVCVCVYLGACVCEEFTNQGQTEQRRRAAGGRNVRVGLMDTVWIHQSVRPSVHPSIHPSILLFRTT